MRPPTHLLFPIQILSLSACSCSKNSLALSRVLLRSPGSTPWPERWKKPTSVHASLSSSAILDQSSGVPVLPSRSGEMSTTGTADPGGVAPA